jgi:hypothetical protein
MRVRKRDANGDYTIGQGEANFWINSPEGVAQKVETRLGLWEGEWFLDKTRGTPYLQKILGYNTASLRDVALRTIILETDGVTALNTYSSQVGGNGPRGLTVSGTITTVYSTTPVPFQVVL